MWWAPRARGANLAGENPNLGHEGETLFLRVVCSVGLKKKPIDE